MDIVFPTNPRARPQPGKLTDLKTRKLNRQNQLSASSPQSEKEKEIEVSSWLNQTLYDKYWGEFAVLTWGVSDYV